MALALAAAAGGCGETIQPEYQIRLLIPEGQDPLAAGTSLTLEAIDVEGKLPAFRTTQPLVAGSRPTLNLDGLDPRKLRRATFTATVNGPAGPLAFGRTPPISLSRDENLVRLAILIQQFGTLARPFPATATPLIPRLSEINMVTAYARDARDAPAVPVPVMFGSTTLDVAGVEQPARIGIIYNPYIHGTTRTSVAPAATTGASVWARSDGTIWHFGGRILPTLNAMGQPTDPNATLVYGSTAFQLGIGQYLSVLTVDQISQHGSMLGRADAAITELLTPTGTVLLVFGGETTVAGEKTVLKSVVSIDPLQPNPAQVVQASPLVMSTPRARHTATAVSVTVPAPRIDVLLFGGLPVAPADPALPGAPPPVAEVFDGAAGVFVALGADAGPNRLDHAVIGLPDGRLLIACGVDGAGAPPVDARVYDPATRTFAVAPLALARARANATCFAVGTDLVIAGGVTAGGEVVPNAEIFDLATLAPVGVVPAAPRQGAAVAAMPDGSVLVAGGRERLNDRFVPANVLEIYRPRATP